MMRQIPAALLLVALATSTAVGAAEKRERRGRAYPPVLPGAKVEVYKTVGDVKLNMNVYFPEGHRPGDRRAAVVFFFGGGWRGGSPAQFQQHCQYLASRGMVAMAADYRVLSRHKTKAVKCVADAKSAVRWIRANAERLGVDPAVPPWVVDGDGRPRVRYGSIDSHLAFGSGWLSTPLSSSPEMPAHALLLTGKLPAAQARCILGTLDSRRQCDSFRQSACAPGSSAARWVSRR